MVKPGSVDRERAALGVRHTLRVLASPRAVFERVEDTSAYGWALVVLLALVLLAGYAEVQTGLIDRVMDQKTEASLASLEETQAHLVDRVELREGMDDLRKAGEFNKFMYRLAVIVLKPTYFLVSFLLIASVMYAIVALTGRKPEYHTLMSICVYASFVELVGFIVRLAMVLYYRTTEVDTSLRLLAAPGSPTPLAVVDPFRIWFWVLVAFGLMVTRQLSRRMAIASCAAGGLLAAGVRLAIEYVPKS